MPYSVKGVGQIKLDDHSFLSSKTAGVDGVLNKDNIIKDFPPFDETSLIFRDNFRQNSFEPVSYDFGDYLVPSVA